MASALVTELDTEMPHRIVANVFQAGAWALGGGGFLAAAFAQMQAQPESILSVLVGIGTMAGSLMLGYASAIRAYMAYVDWRERRMSRLAAIKQAVEDTIREHD